MRHQFALVLVLAQLGCATKNDPKSPLVGSKPPPPREAAEASLTKATTVVSVVGDAPVKMLAAPIPEYPQRLLDAGVQGVVRIYFFIEPDGTVSSPTIIGSPPSALAAFASQAIVRWRFEPILQNGQAIRVRAEQTFIFKIAE